MVYKKSYKNRRYSKRKSYNNQSAYSKYGPAIAQIAGAAATIVAKRYLNTEYKFKDNTGNQSPDNVNGLLTLLNAMQQGTTESTRVGSSFRMKSVLVQGRVTINASAAHTTVRAALVYDKQANGASPTYSSAAGGAGIYENASVESWRDLANSRRYKVLKQRVFVVDASQAEERAFRMIHHFGGGGKVTHYPGKNAGDITDISTGSLYLVLFSDETTNTPTVQWRSRVRFIDN